MTSSVRRIADLIACLMKKPQTHAELREVLEVTDKVRLQTYINALHDEGLVYVAEWKKSRALGGYSPVYAWQPSVCHFPDAPKPAPAGRS